MGWREPRMTTQAAPDHSGAACGAVTGVQRSIRFGGGVNFLFG